MNDRSEAGRDGAGSGRGDDGADGGRGQDGEDGLDGPAVMAFAAPLTDAFRLIVPPSPYPTIIEVERYRPEDEPRARRAGGKFRITADGMPQVFRMRRTKRIRPGLTGLTTGPNLGIGGVS